VVIKRRLLLSLVVKVTNARTPSITCIMVYAECWIVCLPCVCVGVQAKEHVESNVALAAAPQLTPRLWRLVHQQMQETLQQRQQ
jgi:hypothetical protein